MTAFFVLAAALAPAPAPSAGVTEATLRLALAANVAPGHVPATAAAEGGGQDGTLRLTLADAVARARASSPRLAALRAHEDAAAASWQGARATRRPEVATLAGYTRYSDVPELTLALPGAPPRTLFPNLPYSLHARLEGRAPLYTGHRLESLVDAARAERDAARLDVEGGGADVVLEATAAYWALVGAREDARVLASAIASYDAHRKSAGDREAVGLAARNEVLAVQVERDRAELARLVAGRDARVANEDLIRLLALAPGTEVEPVEPLERADAARDDLETLVAAALAARPEVRALGERIAAAEARTEAQRGARRPQVGLVAGWEVANPNRRILPLTDEFQATWDAGVDLSLSVFDGGRTSAAVAQAKALAAAARADLTALRRRVRLEVAARHADVETAVAASAVADEAVASATESRRVAADRYEQGLVPSSELLDAETALLRAGLDRTLARVRIRAATAGLDRAAGR